MAEALVDRAPQEDLRLDAGVLEELGALHQRGLSLVAWKRAVAIAPLRTWRGTAQRILAMRLLHATGAPRQASRIAIEAFRADRTDPTACFYMGFETLRRRGPLSTLQFLQPRRIETAQWAVLEARVLLQLRDFDGADRALRRAEQLRPDDAWVRVERGTWFEGQDRYDDALVVAHEALAAEPDSLAALHLVAHVLRLHNRDEEARELLAAASARLQNATLPSHLAAIEIDLELYAEARASYERVVELSPEMELEWAQWLCARRSDVAYLCGDLDAALETARASQTPFHLKVAERMEKEPHGKRVRLPARFVRQHHMTCAPATLSAISELWKMPADHLQVAEEICYDGTSNHSERRWAEENGFRTREFTVTWEAARALLDRGVAFTLTTVEPGSGHLQAVIGYDDRRGVLLVRDPFLRTLVEIEAEAGLKRWAATGPRGLALVPLAQAALLDGLDLPDALERDLLFAVDSALHVHDRPRAETALAQLLARSPRHPVAIQARRALASYDGDPRELLECADALLALFPDDANLLLSRVQSLRQLGRRGECVEALRPHQGKVRDGDPLLWIELATELRNDASRQREAAGLLRRALRYRPSAGAAWHCLADLRWEEWQRQDALAFYWYASCLEDKREHHANSYFLAARALDRAEEALRVLRDRFERFAAKSSQPAGTLFRALDALQRGQEAFAVLDRALELRPDDLSLLLFAADESAKVGQMAKAQGLLDRAGQISRGTAWHRAAAAIAEYRGEQETALAHCRTVLSTEPLAVDAHESVARLLAQTSGAEAALAHLEAACGRFPHHYRLRQLWLGRLRAGDPAKAVEVARAMVGYHPGDAWSRRELALLLQRLGRNDEAFAEMDAAARLEPDSTTTLNVRGSLLENAHRTEEAREQYRKSLRLDVDQPDPLGALLRLCRGMEERRRELELVREELRRQVTFGPALLEFQREAQEALPADEILAELRAAHRARPGIWEAGSACIVQLVRMGRNDEALEMARAAAERFALVPGSFRDLASVHAERGEIEAQKAALERALQLAPAWTEPVSRLAQVYEREKEYARAKEILERGIAAAPLNPFAHGHLAGVLHALGEKEQAVQRLERALDLAPDYEWAWARLREWSADAAGFARQVCKRKPWSAGAWLALARLGTDLDERLSALDEAGKRDPRSIDVYDLRALAFAEAGRFDEADVACRPAALGDPAPVPLRGRAAWVLARRGKRKEAISALRQLCTVERDYRWGISLWIDLCREENDAPGLRDAAALAIALEPKNAYFHGTAAEARLLLSDHAGAKVELEKAVELDPTYSWAGLTLIDEQFDGNELAAAAATLARLEAHCPGPFVSARAVQLAVRKDDKAEAKRRFAEVCAAPDSTNWPVDAAAQAVASTRWTDVLREVLGAAVEKEGSHPQVGAAWFDHIGRGKWFLPLWRELARLRTRGPAGLRATESYLGTASLLVAYAFIRRFNAALREHLSLWAMAGFALVSRRRYRAARHWLFDYRARKPEPWMMINVIAALQAGPNDPATDSAIEFARALPGAEQEAKLRQWSALRQAVAGKAPPLEPEPTEEFWLFLHRLTRAAAASADGVADRTAAFRQSRIILAAALSPYLNRRLGVLKRRVLSRVVRRIARARGGAIAAIWGWLKLLRGAVI